MLVSSPFSVGKGVNSQEDRRVYPLYLDGRLTVPLGWVSENPSGGCVIFKRWQSWGSVGWLWREVELSLQVFRFRSKAAPLA